VTPTIRHIAGVTKSLCRYLDLLLLWVLFVGCSSEPASEPSPTCAPCRVNSYVCSRAGFESFNFVPSEATSAGCRSAVYPKSQLWCEPLKVCGSPDKCLVVTEQDGVLSWTESDGSTVTCYPS
jgi:hypothetical protein